MAEFAIKLTDSGSGLSIILGSDDIIKSYNKKTGVVTVTMSGTSGTADVSAANVNRVATFNTDIPTTVSDFVTAYAADYLAVGITLTGATNDLVFTPVDPSLQFAVGATSGLTGDLAGAHVRAGAEVLYSKKGARPKIALVDQSPAAITTATGAHVEVSDLANSTVKTQIAASRIVSANQIDPATEANGTSVWYNSEGARLELIQIDETVTALDVAIVAL